MRSYPIWHDITACNYKSSKSYGSKNTAQTKVYVGTGANNSHLLGEVITTRRVANGVTSFKLSVDDVIIKEIKMCNETNTIL